MSLFWHIISETTPDKTLPDIAFRIILRQSRIREPMRDDKFYQPPSEIGGEQD
jgi:hypothetical protein